MALLESNYNGLSDDDFEGYLVRTYNAARRSEATRFADAIARALEEGARAVKAARLTIED